jgi:hypothetical protein
MLPVRHRPIRPSDSASSIQPAKFDIPVQAANGDRKGRHLRNASAGCAEAIRANNQALASAAILRYGEMRHPSRPVFDLMLRFAVSEDGRLHSEKYYRTVTEEFAGGTKGDAAHFDFSIRIVVICRVRKRFQEQLIRRQIQKGQVSLFVATKSPDPLLACLICPSKACEIRAGILSARTPQTLRMECEIPVNLALGIGLNLAHPATIT